MVIWVGLANTFHQPLLFDSLRGRSDVMNKPITLTEVGDAVALGSAIASLGLDHIAAFKQRMEAELDEARKEARDAAAQLGRVTGELDALRSQVASQEATIRGFTAKKADKT